MTILDLKKMDSKKKKKSPLVPVPKSPEEEDVCGAAPKAPKVGGAALVGAAPKPLKVGGAALVAQNPLKVGAGAAARVVF